MCRFITSFISFHCNSNIKRFALLFDSIWLWRFPGWFIAHRWERLCWLQAHLNVAMVPDSRRAGSLDKNRCPGSAVGMEFHSRMEALFDYWIWGGCFGGCEALKNEFPNSVSVTLYHLRFDTITSNCSASCFNAWYVVIINSFEYFLGHAATWTECSSYWQHLKLEAILGRATQGFELNANVCMLTGGEY